MAIHENSRYLRTPMMVRNNWNTYVFDVRQRFYFNEDQCQLYEWIEGDTLDGVAYKMYGYTALRWAILDANPKYQTEFDIKNGDRILIPNYEEVVDVVNV